MCRVIIAALKNLPELPAADNKDVIRMAKKRKVDLKTPYKYAFRVLLEREAT